MPKKMKFSPDDEEIIINFVKSHEILYNAKHRHHRNSEAKNRLWQQLASILDIEVEVVKHKWITMRDYFARKGRKSAKRNEALSFLLQTPKKPPSPSLKANIASSELPKKHESVSNHAPQQSDSCLNADSKSFAKWSADSCFEDQNSSVPVLTSSPVATSKKLKDSHLVEDVEMHDFYNTQSTPSADFILHTSKDEIQQFFDSMAATTRKLSPLAVARIKLKIAQIIGEEEISWAESGVAHNVDCVYLPHTTQPTKDDL